MNSHKLSLLFTKFSMSFNLFPLTCFRARTRSLFLFSACALFFSAMRCSILRYPAYSLFYSLVSILVRISMLSSCRRLSAASLLYSWPLILSKSLCYYCLRLSSYSVNLLSRSSCWFSLVSLKIKFVSSAFMFSAFAFSTTFWSSASFLRAAYSNLSYRFTLLRSYSSLKRVRACCCLCLTFMAHSYLFISILALKCSAFCYLSSYLAKTWLGDNLRQRLVNFKCTW